MHNLHTTVRHDLHRFDAEGADEDINYNTSTSTPTAPEAFQAPPTPPGAPPPQAQAPSSTLGPITRAHARELNYIMLLKNEGPEE